MLALIAVSVLVLHFYGDQGDRVVADVKSASGLRAVAVEYISGAMAPTETEIHVMKAGDRISRANRVFGADRITDLNIRWVDGNHLSVMASSAHISDLTNYGWVEMGNRSEPFWISFNIQPSVVIGG